MNNTKRLAAQVAGAVAIATLVGASAFAESRPLNTTDDSRSTQAYARRDDRGRNHSSDRHDTRSNTRSDRRDQGRPQAQVDRSGDRGRAQSDVYRNTDRSRTQNDVYRNGDRGRTQSETFRNGGAERFQSNAYRNGGNERSQSYGNRSSISAFDSRGRQSMSFGGRISRFSHERGGYRVWVDGGRFPLWIPEARISLFPRLRVGLSLRVGGYYDPLGFIEAYDYYDGYGAGGYGAGGYGSVGYGAGGYGAGGYGAGGYSSGVLRGVVETVDYRRGTMVLRDDVSGNFVTAIIRDRRLESLRPGDYAEISGDWNRSGVFEALRLEDVGGGRY